jgi:hypothetical protein
MIEMRFVQVLFLEFMTNETESGPAPSGLTCVHHTTPVPPVPRVLCSQTVGGASECSAACHKFLESPDLSIILESCDSHHQSTRADCKSSNDAYRNTKSLHRVRTCGFLQIMVGRSLLPASKYPDFFARFSAIHVRPFGFGRPFASASAKAALNSFKSPS